MTLSRDHDAQPAAVLYRPAAAARLWATSRSRVYEHLRAGTVMSVQLGTRGRRIPASEIERVALEGLPDLPRSRRRQAT